MPAPLLPHAGCRHPGAATIGEHTWPVLSELLSYDPERAAELAVAGAVEQSGPQELAQFLPWMTASGRGRRASWPPMDDVTGETRPPLLSRRFLLTGLGAGAAVLLGCSGDDAESTAAPGSTAGTSSGATSSSTTGAPTSSTTTSTTAASTTTAAAPATTLAPTPACDDGDDTTPSQTEGPFFTPDSPLKASFLGDVSSGTRLALRGTVVTTACAPVGGALVDLWHTDDAGAYDNDGYRLRGHQFADNAGNWAIETIVPGLYTGRTRHLHVKVQAPGGRVLTTQLYFPNEPGNARDGIFREECLLDIAPDGNGQRGTFTFVLDA